MVFTGNIIRQPAFRHIEMKTMVGGYPESDKVMQGGVLLAVHHGLSEEMITHIHASFEEFARNYRKVTS